MSVLIVEAVRLVAPFMDFVDFRNQECSRPGNSGFETSCVVRVERRYRTELIVDHAGFQSDGPPCCLVGVGWDSGAAMGSTSVRQRIGDHQINRNARRV